MTRIGFLIDGDPNTELMTALYEHDDLGVRLKVPFLVNEDIRGRWWGHGTMYADDPDRTKYSYTPPEELDYFDNKGPVGLIGCRSGSAQQKFGGVSPDAGVGVMNATFAVEGARAAAHYVKLNGLRSEIDGLGQWLGYSAVKSFVKWPKDGSARELSTTASPVEDVPLGPGLNLKAVAHAVTSGQRSPEVTYRSKVFLETFTKANREWGDHLTPHFGVRDLLRVAAWQPINFVSHQAACTKETVPVNGKDLQTWREVRTIATSRSEPSWKVSDRFLFTCADIGKTGLNRWLKLAKAYHRGIDPLIRLLDLEGATIDAHVMQLGIAMEAIGYHALIDSGKSPGAANGTAVEKRIEFLLGEVAGAISFTNATFAKDFADSYNSVKHANRAMIPPAKKLEDYRNGVELLRAWAALKLGVKKNVLRQRW